MPVFAAIVGIGFVGLLVTVIIGIARDAERTRRAEWNEAAVRFGLGMPPRGFWSTTAEEIGGTIDGMDLRVKGHGGKGAQTIYELHVPMKDVQISAEGIGSSIGRWIAGEDVQIGDPAFDSAVFIRGKTADQRALFDEKTRTAALRVIRLGGSVSDGKIRIVSGGLETKASNLVERIEALAELGRRLAWAHDVGPAQRLADVAKADPLPEVRANALQSLLERAGNGRLNTEIVDGAIAAALEDPDAGNRFAAATLPRVSRVESRRVLLELVRDSKTPDAVRAKAIQRLGRFDGIPDADSILEGVLQRGGNEARIAAIEALARRQAHASRIVPFATKRHAPTRAAVALALAKIGTSADQETLLRMLDDEDDSVRLAAAGALGAIADVGAVEKLRTLTGFLGGELARAAESAIASIQSRAAGAGAGQLSVSDSAPSAGSLSQAAEDGALSEPDAPGPRPRKAPA